MRPTLHRTHHRSTSPGILLWCGLAALVLGCGSAGKDDHAPNHTEDRTAAQEERDEIIRLTPAEMAEFGIELASAGPGEIARYVELPGEVRPNQERLAHIVPRFPGIVMDVRKRIGDAVEKGDTLAVIESSESIAPYKLRTLMAGTVIGKHITRGEAVTRETEAFVIADLETVWVVLSVYQRDLPLVRIGQPAVISAGHGLPEFSGTISYVTPVVSEETRTATARVELPNQDGVWRPGMFVTGQVVVDATNVPIAVPRTALQSIDGKSIVFVKSEDGFSPRQVQVGRNSEMHVEIQDGLAVGERYVSRGGFTLKAEISREQFGEGHGH